MNKTLFIFSICVIFFSCSRVKQTTKEVLNKGGETVGESATEFFEGVSEGVDKTLKCEISLSENLNAKGISHGIFSINKENGNNNRNVLTIYMIFDKAFDGEMIVKAYDKNNLEIGRSKLSIKKDAGETGYFDFTFDKRTDISVRSKIVIE